jgi:hypothetical protein
MSTGHPREIELRRVFAGESVPGAASHLGECAVCKAKLKGFEEEQRKFEAEIPFERFAAGVERATRQPRATPAPRRQVMRVAMAIAAGVVVLAGALVLKGGDPDTNRLKGGTGVDVIIASPANGPQRLASQDPQVPEALAPGEWLRIGFRSGGYRYLTAVSIDESGEVTALYPERGPSLRVRTAGGTEYLGNDKLAFTGQGLERVVVVMTKEPLDVEDVKRAAKARYDEARGNLSQLGTLDLPGEQFHRTFLKP